MNQELPNLLNLQTQKFNYNQVIKFLPKETQVNYIAISPDDKLLATGSKEGQIIIWDFGNRLELKQYEGQNTEPILYLQFSQDQNYLVALQQTEIRDILLFKVNSTPFIPYVKFYGDYGMFNKIVITNDSKYIISGSQNYAFVIWDIEKQTKIYSKKLSSNVESISISPNQQLIETKGVEQTYIFRIKSVTNIFQVAKWESQSQVSIRGTSFTPDSSKLISCTFRKIKIWSIQSKVKLIKVFSCSFTTDVTIAFNGQVLMNNNGRIRFWNIANGQQLSCIDIPAMKNVNMKFIRQILCSSDMKQIIVSYDGVFIFERVM